MIKRSFSIGLPAVSARSSSKISKREKGLWQRRFWEHQIRDDMDLQRHVDYVHFNPVKHGHAKHAADWSEGFCRSIGQGQTLIKARMDLENRIDLPHAHKEHARTPPRRVGTSYVPTHHTQQTKNIDDFWVMEYLAA